MTACSRITKDCVLSQPGEVNSYRDCSGLSYPTSLGTPARLKAGTLLY